MRARRSCVLPAPSVTAKSLHVRPGPANLMANMGESGDQILAVGRLLVRAT
jgi:hypothetical protein